MNFLQISNRIAVTSNSSIQFVSCDEIIFCKAYGSYTELHMLQQKRLVVSRHLKVVEKNLPHNFYRVHHSYLVNLKHILEIDKGTNLIVLTERHLVEISHRKKTAFYIQLKAL